MLKTSSFRLFKRINTLNCRAITRSIATNIFTANVKKCLLINNTYTLNNVIGRNYSASSAGGFKIPEEVVNLDVEFYHKTADIFLEDLSEKFEDISQDYPQEVPEVEYNQGVLSITVPKVGTYVINKQPPNKQIWLASPVSGPNRYDYYKGDWVSLRDNTKLMDILEKEFSKVISNAKTYL